VSPVKYELGYYIAEDDILQRLLYFKQGRQFWNPEDAVRSMLAACCSELYARGQMRASSLLVPALFRSSVNPITNLNLVYSHSTTGQEK
jgi:hypothetical protein